MKKKVLSVLLVAAMAMSMLTGCGNGNLRRRASGGIVGSGCRLKRILSVCAGG